MKRIEDIKKFKDIDTYYEISKIVEEVFEDRVEAHKHLVTANKEIEKLNQYVDFYKDLGEKQNKEIESLKQINEEHQKLNGELRVENDRLNNVINELEKYINGRIEYCYNNGSYQDVFDVYNEIDMKLQELKGSDKE